ncbi:MAG: hypothetical protein JNL08_01950 [Planctomycetes bacterium]|nr:hypothetical protein [Planctomycetota bacterium]
MLRALDRDPHAQRLDDLLRSFRTQEAAMVRLLAEVSQDLECCQREANFLRATRPAAAERMLDRCRDLQLECDLLATELVHVRMAVAGAGDELDEHRRRRPHGAEHGTRLPA